jgi:hypothetical protein
LHGGVRDHMPTSFSSRKEFVPTTHCDRFALLGNGASARAGYFKLNVTLSAILAGITTQVTDKINQ